MFLKYSPPDLHVILAIEQVSGLILRQRESTPDGMVVLRVQDVRSEQVFPVRIDKGSAEYLFLAVDQPITSTLDALVAERRRSRAQRQQENDAGLKDIAPPQLAPFLFRDHAGGAGIHVVAPATISGPAPAAAVVDPRVKAAADVDRRKAALEAALAELRRLNEAAAVAAGSDDPPPYVALAHTR